MYLSMLLEARIPPNIARIMLRRLHSSTLIALSRQYLADCHNIPSSDMN
jgi:hypothetical protein